MDELITRETMVPSADPGISIYVRNKRPAATSTFPPERTVLFVHGATYPAETAFDLRLDGISWMEFIARRGFDVYLLDVRGYGRSTRPSAMDAPAEANPPFADTASARRDVDVVVEHIRRERSVSRVVLISWSWGCAIMGSYAAAHPDKVEKLVQFAPGWLREAPSPTDQGGRLGAWRAVTREDARKRWLNGVPESKRNDLIPAGWFDAWADATFATDPIGAAQTPPVLRAPNGVVQDSREFWAAGRPLYDPARITAPTMIVVGEWDHDTPPTMAQALFARLVNTPRKRLAMIGEATHTVLMERNRMELFEQVQLFLEDGLPQRRGDECN
ncbi:MAG: alpha/beta hydrolase [Alphaproteobacteria bacterium]|nr:alpha/beta hydrolase [Alphaproteobacteria bacterium]